MYIEIVLVTESRNYNSDANESWIKRIIFFLLLFLLFGELLTFCEYKFLPYKLEI